MMLAADAEMKKQFTASLWLLTLPEAPWMVSRDFAPGFTMTFSIRIIFALVLLRGWEKNAHETRKDVKWNSMNAKSGVLCYVSYPATLVTFAYHTASFSRYTSQISINTQMYK